MTEDLTIDKFGLDWTERNTGSFCITCSDEGMAKRVREHFLRYVLERENHIVRDIGFAVFDVSEGERARSFKVGVQQADHLWFVYDAIEAIAPGSIEKDHIAALSAVMVLAGRGFEYDDTVERGGQEDQAIDYFMEHREEIRGVVTNISWLQFPGKGDMKQPEL